MSNRGGDKEARTKTAYCSRLLMSLCGGWQQLMSGKSSGGRNCCGFRWESESPWGWHCWWSLENDLSIRSGFSFEDGGIINVQYLKCLIYFLCTTQEQSSTTPHITDPQRASANASVLKDIRSFQFGAFLLVCRHYTQNRNVSYLNG